MHFCLKAIKARLRCKFFYEQIPARFGEIANTPVPLLNLYLFHKLLQIIFENILICFIKILGKIIREILRIDRKGFVWRIVIWGDLHLILTKCDYSVIIDDANHLIFKIIKITFGIWTMIEYST